jgi:hypothetical protein
MNGDCSTECAISKLQAACQIAGIRCLSAVSRTLIVRLYGNEIWRYLLIVLAIEYNKEIEISIESGLEEENNLPREDDDENWGRSGDELRFHLDSDEAFSPLHGPENGETRVNNVFDRVDGDEGSAHEKEFEASAGFSVGF